MEDNVDGKFDVAIVGGLGHVGLPLGIVFADKGLNVCLCDIDKKNAQLVEKGVMPFIEYGAEPLLKKALADGKLTVSLDNESVSKAKYVVIAIGTPVDEYLNPKTRQFLEFFISLKKHLHEDQIIIIRSTVYPHTCQQIVNLLGDGDWHIAYCPERIVQGYAVKELKELPQIVAGLSEKAIEESSKLFNKISPKIVRTPIGEAEMIKLFSNAWRYIQFAVANQFYMISHNFGVDYDKIRSAMREGYERAHSLPGAGFAAGPCLLKDTMQLSAFNSNNFLLGHAAMMINEGLPNFLVENLRKKHDLSKKKVGILGMAFKSDIDDVRDSLSFKLGKILRFHGAKVYYSDEYAKNQDFVSKEELIKSSDIVIVAVPHSAYKNLIIPKNIEVVDLWNVTEKKQHN
ncbi:nucleotide sugar dehydrogenase [Candidatus Woesearchaeota archaeon]|jgi:UDP-N-acetyl-D-mannosaminuronic acid dehydrogenase|nr:nucleotide sugar dehydrogenase [Candidatus Woesearchaeota archaeon]|tara:strand:- start:2011 stop:3213 length:1203 start_codon:yes stop_codon:yes gene_type:complete